MPGTYPGSQQQPQHHTVMHSHVCPVLFACPYLAEAFSGRSQGALATEHPLDLGHNHSFLQAQGLLPRLDSGPLCPCSQPRADSKVRPTESQQG